MRRLDEFRLRSRDFDHFVFAVNHRQTRGETSLLYEIYDKKQYPAISK